MANSMIQTFQETVAQHGDRPAARFRDASDKWVTYTWKQMDELRAALGTGLLLQGVQANERVNILANTSEKWMIADLAVQSCGAEPVPIYQSNLPHEVEYIINDCGAVVVVAENKEQLDKLLSVKSNIPNVRKVVVMDDTTDGTDWTVGWSELLETGRANRDARAEELAARTSSLTPDDVLTIIYTSGTTGNPKGVVLPHSAMLYEVEAIRKIDLIRADDVEFLFLPMAHVFAKVLQCVWFGLGHEMAIHADIQRITENLGEVKPTIMASVPRIFEKVYAKVVGGGMEAPGLKGKLFKWAVGLNDQYAQLMIDGKPIPFGLDVQLGLAKKLVFSKVNERLNGIFGGRMRYFVSGGAPLSKKIAYFFDNCGVIILEGYGLTETSAATCVNRPAKYKIGTVGPALPGTDLKIAEDGEILIRGGGVMREYWKREDATGDVLASDGWFATGDIGTIDADGYLKITDRKKDIIVTAGGKNVAPQNIENLVKAASPLISQVVIHGDKRKYLTALVTLDSENAIKLGSEAGVGSDYTKVTQSDAARQRIQAVFDQVNGNLAKYETIKKFTILEKDFEIGDELTPSLK
ncbi:MAG: long-chain fatty acid--CoA ligase, partial [Myxococcales bacterium]|nr:long-chain fatty acid--CoA ligase [Myxococcales bacterium]